MNRPTWLVVAVIAISAGVVGGALGYVLHPANAPSPSQVAQGTLSVTAAGTLGTLFPRAASALANETPGVSASTSAQEYQGSLAALAAITQLHGTFDVAAAADYRLIPQLLEPTFASYECVFATTPEALAYDPSVSAFQGINTTNWPEKLVGSGLPLAIANASTDPNGYNEIFVLELEGLLQNDSLSTLYGHYFTTAVGSVAQPNPATTRVEPETQAATLIGDHQVAAFIIYQSYATSHHLAYVPLDPKVSLGSLDASNLANYAHASTAILTPAGRENLTGSLVAFSVTVPTNAPNPTLGVAFIHLLLSPQGGALIAAAGFTPIFPAWSDQVAAAPPLLQPDLSALPSTLANSLT